MRHAVGRPPSREVAPAGRWCRVRTVVAVAAAVVVAALLIGRWATGRGPSSVTAPLGPPPLRPALFGLGAIALVVWSRRCRARDIDAERRRAATQAARLEALLAASQAMAAEDRWEPVLVSAAGAMQAAVGADDAAVRLLEPNGRALGPPLAWAAPQSPPIGSSDQRIPLDGDRPEARAARTGELIALPAPTTAGRWAKGASQLVVPLRARDRPVGVVVLGYPADRTPDPAGADPIVRSSVATFAAQAALVLDRRLRRAAQAASVRVTAEAAVRADALRELSGTLARCRTERQVLEESAAGLERIFQPSAVVAALRNANGGLRPIVQRGAGGDAVGATELPAQERHAPAAPAHDGRAAASTERRAVAPSTAGADAHPTAPVADASVAVQVDGRVVGSLELAFDAPRRLPPRDREALEAVAGMCGEALGRTRHQAGERLAMRWLGRLEAERARREVGRQLLAVAEDGRRRLAGELHDGPVQQLSVAAMRLADVRRRVEAGEDGAALARRLEQVKEGLGTAIGDLRTTMVRLYPPAFDEMTLGEAIELHLAEQAAEPSWLVSIDTRLPLEPPPAIKAVLYRVAAEAITNVRQHAGAAALAVSVGLAPDAECIVLTVQDDGVGVDTAALSAERLHAAGRVGVLGMRNAVTMLGGTWEIERGSPAGGTRVAVSVPLASEQRS